MFTFQGNLCKNFYRNVYVVAVLVGLNIESRSLVSSIFLLSLYWVDAQGDILAQSSGSSFSTSQTLKDRSAGKVLEGEIQISRLHVLLAEYGTMLHERLTSRHPS